MPNIKDFSECWGISIIYCPYCHGYEVKNEKVGILGNGDFGFEFSKLILNWNKDLTLFTNGPSALTDEQKAKFKNYKIKLIETEIECYEHIEGNIQNIIFKDGTSTPIKALYAHLTFEQNCTIPEDLGCELTEHGFIKTDHFQKTTVHGVAA